MRGRVPVPVRCARAPGSGVKAGKGNPGFTHMEQLPHKLRYRTSSSMIHLCGILIGKSKARLFNAIAELNIFRVKHFFKSSRYLIGFSGDGHIKGSWIEARQSLPLLSPQATRCEGSCHQVVEAAHEERIVIIDDFAPSYSPYLSLH